MITALIMCKNEAAVIQRCLTAAAEAGCDNLVLHDTGSTDDTVSLAIQSAHLFESAHIHRAPWVSYGDNRTMLLAHSRRLFPEGYSWVLDADEQAHRDPSEELTSDGYFIPIRLGEHDVYQARIFSNRSLWRYEGIVHEHPECQGATMGTLARTYCVNHNDGHQGTLDAEGIRQRRLQEAAQFKRELERDPNCSRAAYYLAQSYQCAGEHAHAYAAHMTRAKMAGWQEESYQSLVWVAKYREWWNWPLEMVVSAWAEAAQHRPSRAEAWIDLARVLMKAGRYQEAAQALAAAPRETKDLFCVHLPSYHEQPDRLAYELLDAAPELEQDYPQFVEMAARHLLTPT